MVEGTTSPVVPGHTAVQSYSTKNVAIAKSLQLGAVRRGFTMTAIPETDSQTGQ